MHEYDRTAMKKGLPFIRGIQFEVDEGTGVALARLRSKGPVAVARFAEMPSSTVVLVHMVKSIFYGMRHALVERYSVRLSSDKVFTRVMNSATADTKCLKDIGFDLTTIETVLRKDVSVTGYVLEGEADLIAKGLREVVWDDDSKPDVVLDKVVAAKATDALERMKRATGRI